MHSIPDDDEDIYDVPEDGENMQDSPEGDEVIKEESAGGDDEPWTSLGDTESVIETVNGRNDKRKAAQNAGNGSSAGSNISKRRRVAADLRSDSLAVAAPR